MYAVYLLKILYKFYKIFGAKFISYNLWNDSPDRSRDWFLKTKFLVSEYTCNINCPSPFRFNQKYMTLKHKTQWLQVFLQGHIWNWVGDPDDCLSHAPSPKPTSWSSAISVIFQNYFFLSVFTALSFVFFSFNCTLVLNSHTSLFLYVFFSFVVFVCW